MLTEESANYLSKKIEQRNYSVDTFRLIAIFFVILHHVQAFKYSYHVYYPNPVLTFLYYFPEMVRLLPFFFIAAGYFFHKGILNGKPIGKRLYKYCKRLVKLFFIWFFFYAFVFPPTWARPMGLNMWETFYLNIGNAMNHPVVALMTGNDINLWFFPALIIGLIIVSIFHKLRIEKLIIPTGLFLYLLALMGKSYSVISFGYHFDFEMRHGPFISTLFVGIGWMLADKKVFRLKIAFSLITVGILMGFSEIIYFIVQHNIKPNHEFLLSHIFINTGIFWFMLAHPNIGKNTVFPEWGKLTLGVYCFHRLVMQCIGGGFKPYMHPVVYDIFRPVTVYLICLIITFMCMRNKYTRVLIT